MTKRGREVAVLVKCSIQHQANAIDTTWIQIKAAEGEIYSINFPPGEDLETEQLDHIFEGEKPLIIAGDWYSNHTQWNSTKRNRRGRRG